jgi:hypothetical protein
MMDNVDTVSLSLTKEIAADIEQRVSWRETLNYRVKSGSLPFPADHG